jgi:hypothetical protein
MGFIAQEMLDVVPDVVSGSEDTEYHLTMTDLIPTLVNAIKQLSAEVADLKQQVASLLK